MAVGFPAKTNFATGDVLTATNMNDVTGTLNLLQSTLYPAGRNKIINGDFRFNQRAFTSNTTSGTYSFDRWLFAYSDGTVTVTPQTFTLGAAPVAGYEGTNYVQLAVTGQTLSSAQAQINQRIESVKTFAGETVIMSFWAKATSGTPNILAGFSQNFGTGGSPSATVSTNSTAQAITTSWARYSFTVTLPSISGKTLGTAGNDFLAALIWLSGGSATSVPTVGIQNNTFQIWGVQLESASTGSTASPFQTASGSIAGELALCQRYYWRNQATGTASQFSIAAGTSATTAQMTITLPVKMRANATPLEYSTLALGDNIGVGIAVTNLAIATNSDQTPSVIATVAAGLTANRPYYLGANASANAYIAFSAEL